MPRKRHPIFDNTREGKRDLRYPGAHNRKAGAAAGDKARKNRRGRRRSRRRLRGNE
jgi:hypothetical protein